MLLVIVCLFSVLFVFAIFAFCIYQINGSFVSINGSFLTIVGYIVHIQDKQAALMMEFVESQYMSNLGEQIKEYMIWAMKKRYTFGQGLFFMLCFYFSHILLFDLVIFVFVKCLFVQICCITHGIL